MDFTSQVIAGTKSYQAELERKAKASGKTFGAQFSASLDYQEVEKGSESSESVFTKAETACCACVAELVTFSPPSFDPALILGSWLYLL